MTITYDPKTKRNVFRIGDYDPPLFLYIPVDYVKIPLSGHTRWVEALESGDYLQDTGQLSSPKGDCCLGVLSKTQGRLVYDDISNCYRDGGLNGSHEVISNDNPLIRVLDKNGDFPSDVSTGPQTRYALTDLNDNHVTFCDIATALRLLWCEAQ